MTDEDRARMSEADRARMTDAERAARDKPASGV